MKSRLISCLSAFAVAVALLLGAGVYGVIRASIAQGRAQRAWVTLDGPGFSTKLPAWPERVPSRSSFHAGTTNVGTPDGGLVLRWVQAPRRPTLDELSAMVGVMNGTLLHPAEFEPARPGPGHARAQVEVDRPQGVWSVATAWYCPDHERGYLLICTRRSRSNALALQRQVLAQFVCHQPCEVPETLPMPSLETLPEGWTERVDRADQRVYQRGDDEALVFSLSGLEDSGIAQLEPDAIAKIVRAAYGLEFQLERTLEQPRPHAETAYVWVGTGTDAEGTQVRVVFSLWSCDQADGYAGIYLGTPDGEHDAVTWVSQAACVHSAAADLR